MATDNEIGFEILRAIRRILRKVSDRSRQLAREAGLTLPQLLCLRAIARASAEGDVTVAEVARRVQLSPATVSRILDRLEQGGTIVRERAASDRRKVLLSLTPTGRTRLEGVPTPLHEQFLERVNALPSAERRALLRSLQEIVVMMEATDVDAAPLLTPEDDVKRPPPSA